MRAKKNCAYCLLFVFIYDDDLFQWHKVCTMYTVYIEWHLLAAEISKRDSEKLKQNYSANENLNTFETNPNNVIKNKMQRNSEIYRFRHMYRTPYISRHWHHKSEEITPFIELNESHCTWQENIDLIRNINIKQWITKKIMQNES